MMMLINCFSLLVIFVCLLIMVGHPRISFPVHVDLIMLVIALGALAILINTILGTDMYWHKQNAEIWIRAGFACLTIRYLYQVTKVEQYEND